MCFLLPSFLFSVPAVVVLCCAVVPPLQTNPHRCNIRPLLRICKRVFAFVFRGRGQKMRKAVVVVVREEGCSYREGARKINNTITNPSRIKTIVEYERDTKTKLVLRSYRLDRLTIKKATRRGFCPVVFALPSRVPVCLGAIVRTIHFIAHIPGTIIHIPSLQAGCVCASGRFPCIGKQFDAFCCTDAD